MKKILLIISVIVVVFAITSCKTTEENYRSAYELAKEKKTETGDSLITSQLRSSTLPKPMAFGSDTLPVRTIYVSSYNDSQGQVPKGVLKKYLIVVGQFKQIFNAGSMATRLSSNGYNGAFVVFDRQKEYYVVAAAVDDSAEAAQLINRVKGDKNVVVRTPYPYVLRPTQLTR